MKLRCEKCHNEEDITLLSDDQVCFKYGYIRTLRIEEPKELFRGYEGAW